MTATRSPIVIASTWSWVTYTVVTASCRWMREISARICTRSFASRFESGSSMRKTCGSRTIARPIATRWRWPPDSCRGFRSRWSTRPITRAVSAIRLRASAFATFCIRSGKPMFSATVMCG